MKRRRKEPYWITVADHWWIPNVKQWRIVLTSDLPFASRRLVKTKEQAFSIARGLVGQGYPGVEVSCIRRVSPRSPKRKRDVTWWCRSWAISK